MSLSLRFFNSFQVHSNGRSLTKFRSAKVQGLLVYLSLEADKAHARDVLAALFWPDEPDAVAKKNLRQSLYQLRRVLNDAGDYLIVNRQAVQFNKASDYDLDVQLFLDSVADEDVATAVDLYGGELLPGFTCNSLPFEEWLRLERERLHRLALEAMTQLTESQLVQGDLDAAQKTAHRQLDLEPWRETAHRQLMMALALAGDRNAALAQFDRCYEALQAELGIEPTDQTMALYEQIATAVVTAVLQQQGLPQPTTSFVGRVAEINHIIRTLNKPDCRVFALVGPGGVGKTRLAIKVAHTFVAQTSHEAYFVSLLGVTNVTQALSILAQTIGIPVLDPAQAARIIAAKIGDDTTLLLLDNAEPLLAADGDTFVELLNEISLAAPALRLLVTSRQPLQAQNEWVLPIRGLVMPLPDQEISSDQWTQYDALALFAQRAQQADVTFALTSNNIAAVRALCFRLQGLPLGIELAAAQTRDFSVAEINDLSHSAPADLQADLRDLPPRHRSLWAVFEQSWRLLNKQEQKMLSEVAVFEDGFSRAAAHSILGDGAKHIQSLVEKSLLSRQNTPQGVTTVRYSMAELLRPFLATIAPLDAQVRDRHASYYLTWAVNHTTHLATEKNNIIAAWQWAQQRETLSVPRRWNSDCLSTVVAEAPPTVNPPLMPTVDVLVGRDDEMAVLREVLRPLLHTQQNGGLLTVTGGAGIGKSHLVAQLQAENERLLWFDCPCDESSGQSLLPFRHWLRDYFAQKAESSVALNLAAFDARFDDLLLATTNKDLASELSRLRSFLAALVDIVLPDSLYQRLRPEQRLENFQQAIKTLIRAESLLQPIVVHVEDAHWIDADSRTLLENLLRNATDFPYVVIVTARPTGFEPLILLDVPQQMVRLGPLTAVAISQLFQHYLGHLPATELEAMLLERSKGNPFHLTQLLLYLNENRLVAKGKLVRTANYSTFDTLLPVDMQNLLLARLGKLEPIAREIVDQAAILGAEFSLPVLDQLVDAELLQQGLDEGVDAGIWHAVSEDRYVFNHILLHDAAYTTQFDTQRQQYHKQAARAVTAVATPQQPQYATIAHHLDAAKDPRRAANYYLRAGDQARDNYFIREAHNHYSRGLLLAQTNKQRLQLLLGREAVNHWLGNREQQKEDLRVLVGLTANSTNKERIADVALRRATFALATAEYNQAIKLSQQATALASAIPDHNLESQAYQRWGRALWQAGNINAAAPLIKRALRLAKAANSTIEQAHCLYDLGVLAFYISQNDEAQEYMQEAIAYFAKEYDKRNIIRATDILGQIAVAESNYEEAIAYFAQALQLSRAASWPYGELYLLAHLGDCHFELGNYDHCRQMHQQALSLAQTLGEKRAEVISLDTLGLAYQFSGDRTRARNHFEKALMIHETINYPRGKAFVQTHLGLLLTDLEETEQAGILLYDALTFRSSTSTKQETIDTEAALAWLDMARGDTEFALEHVRVVVNQLEKDGIIGVELPLQVYWQCYSILRLVGSALEATAVLQSAYDILESLAQRIHDQQLRQNYLTKIPYHHQILTAWSSRTR